MVNVIYMLSQSIISVNQTIRQVVPIVYCTGIKALLIQDCIRVWQNKMSWMVLSSGSYHW